MAFTEDDMRQAINLVTEVSAENRRLRYQRAQLRAALRSANKAICSLGGTPATAHVEIATRGRP